MSPRALGDRLGDQLGDRKTCVLSVSYKYLIQVSLSYSCLAIQGISVEASQKKIPFGSPGSVGDTVTIVASR